jgi:hypothetical protein
MFKTHGKKCIKAPHRPPKKPKFEPENKKVLPDENTWLWEAFCEIREEMERAIQPLYEYVE